MQDSQQHGSLKIAITFDDGPHSTNTPELLNLAAKFQARFTFFVIGNRVSCNRAVVQRQISERHEIGNHSWSHPDLLKLDDDALRTELQRTEDVVANTA